jgi:hypothetical protein
VPDDNSGHFSVCEHVVPRTKSGIPVTCNRFKSPGKVAADVANGFTRFAHVSRGMYRCLTRPSSTS